MAQILYLFFTGSPERRGWIVIPNTVPASISSSPWLFYEAELACSRANSLHCSSSVTRADGFCALKCSCSLTLAAVDSHGNFWVAASSLVTLWRCCRLCLNLFVERSYKFTINNLNVFHRLFDKYLRGKFRRIQTERVFFFPPRKDEQWNATSNSVIYKLYWQLHPLECIIYFSPALQGGKIRIRSKLGSELGIALYKWLVFTAIGRQTYVRIFIYTRNGGMYGMPQHRNSLRKTWLEEFCSRNCTRTGVKND